MNGDAPDKQTSRSLTGSRIYRRDTSGVASSFECDLRGDGEQLKHGIDRIVAVAAVGLAIKKRS